jgi:MBG domain (YGX type)/YDG domain/Bacterial Ig-like domain (group 3)
MRQIERDESGTGDTKRPKAARRVRVALAFGVLLVAGLFASGALGMVSVTGSDTTSTAADTTSTATDTAAPATDMSTGGSTTTTSSTDASTTDTTPTTTEAPPASSAPAPTTTPSIFTPSIASDQQDYNPGATVTLTGHGWAPGDIVHMSVNDDVGQTWSYAADVTADATGSFTVQFALPDWFVADYNVTAMGSSGAVATTAFTDSAVQDVTVAVNPTAAGANATYTIKFTPTNQTSQNIQVTFPAGTSVPASIAAGNITVNGTAAPAASYSITASQRQIQFDPPAVLPANVQATVVIGATSAVIGNPQAGTYTLQLKTKDDNNQATSANYAIAGVKGTTTSLTSSANPSTYPAAVTFTATVVANPSPNPSGAGTVTFKDGGATLCNAVALSGNTATCTPSPALAVGSHSITADYSGTANFAASSGSLTQSVNKANQTISFAQPASPAAYGTSFAINPTASSGLAVAVSVAGPCAYNGALGTVSMSGGSGTCAITASQPGDANYNAAPAVIRNVDAAKANQTISITTHAPGSAAYNSSFTVAANVAGSGNAVSFSSSGACSNSGASFTMTSGSGTCTVKYDQAGDANYNAAPQVSEAVNASKANQTINFGSLASKTYGDADFAVGATSSSGLAVSFSSLGSCTFSLGQVHLTGAGTCTITATQDGDVNYSAASAVPQSFTIAKAPLTLTANDASKVYGAANPAFSGSIQGVVFPDAVTLTLDSPATATSHVGTYPIVPHANAAGGVLANYDVQSTNGTLTITPKPITVTADAQSKVYGSDDPQLSYKLSSGSLEQGDNFSGSLSREPGESVAGSPYPIKQGSLSAGNNYDLSFVGANLAITPKPITVKADDKTKVYGSNDPQLTVTVPAGALEQGDSLSGSLEREAGNNVGSYQISKGSLTAGGNYELTITPGTLKITKKAASLTAEDKSKVYGSADPALTTTDSGFLADDLGAGKITFSASRAAGESVAGSPYTITPSASDGATSLLGNYDITYNPGKLTISKKALTGSFVAADKTYDGNANATVTSRDLSGLVSGDGVSLAGGSAAFETKNAGTAKTVTLTGAALSGADAGNYTLDSVATAKANIAPKPITVQADDKTKVYGSPDPALTVSVPAGALESGDSLSGDLVRAAGKDVDGYAITKGTLTAGANYDLTVTPGTLTITKKPITVKADDKTKVYGSADPALTVTVPAGALEQGDSLSGSLVRASGNNVGTYAITNGSLTAGANYHLTVTPGTFTITKKPITVTADSQTKVVGAADPALTYKVTSGSLESGDSFSGALAGAQGEAVGTYAIAQGTFTAGANYDLTFVGSTLKIVYGWDGFLQPINDTAHQTGVQESKFKLGQTIPAKFVLKNASGTVVRQATDPTFTRSGNLGACDSNAAQDTTDLVNPDTGVTFTWDGSQYHYNWSTKNLAAGEYRIYANLADGTKQYVDICLTK